MVFLRAFLRVKGSPAIMNNGCYNNGLRGFINVKMNGIGKYIRVGNTNVFITDCVNSGSVFQS
ncbi:hypothetical protein [Niastella yeongjuensis]|nr:hypothetical protein [Niastella yeongjuensis]